MDTNKQKREYCKDPAQRKDFRITFRLSATDYQTLLGISENEDKLVSEVLRDWVRSKVREANTTCRSRVDSAEEHSMRV